MSITNRLTFVAAVSDRAVLKSNLMISPCLRKPNEHQLLIQEGFLSASQAYNDGLSRAKNEIVIFVHQDVYLPSKWISQLQGALDYLEQRDPDWGVLGCWGATNDGRYIGHIFSTGWGVLGEAAPSPERVQTLDEIVLIIRKSSALQFDPKLPNFHFYGTDICLRAAERGLKSYAMSAFCIHNTSQLFKLPKEFYSCYSYIRKVWKKNLPIQTPCIRITRLNREVYRRRLIEFCQSFLRKGKQQAAPRLPSLLPLIDQLRRTTGMQNDYL